MVKFMLAPAKILTLSEKIILWMIIAAILLLSSLVIKPILIPLIYGIFLAYIFYPVYIALLGSKKILFSPKTAALTVLIIILAIIIFPVLLLVAMISLNREIIFKFFDDFFLSFNQYYAKYLVFFNQDIFKNISLKISFGKMATTVSNEILHFIQDVITQTPQFLLNSFVALILVYYVLRKADQVIPFLRKIIPLQKKQFGAVIKLLDDFAHGLLASQFVIAVVQAVLMFFALVIINNKYTLLLSLLTFVLALIPLMGAIIVWGILTIYLFANTANGIPLWQPIFMLLYGTLLVSMADNFIRPKILAQNTRINPSVVLIGLIGGFMAFGLPGIFIGPVVLTLLDLASDLFKQII